MNAVARDPDRKRREHRATKASAGDGAGPRGDGQAAAGEGAEVARQRLLLAALAAPRLGLDALRELDASCGLGALAARNTELALRAYRANAGASAQRALTAACPTLRALIGAEDFAHLAREFWRAHPPRCGDLGVWGDALPAWLDAHPGLAAWPYLGDCARLDLALHLCERAAEATLDIATLELLADSAPRRLRLRLRPGVACLSSRWPIATLHAAHVQGGEALFETARARMLAGDGEAVVAARDGWRGVVRRIDAPVLAFMKALLRDADLAQALAAAGEGFDFTAWLADALRHHWLQRVEPCRD